MTKSHEQGPGLVPDDESDAPPDDEDELAAIDPLDPLKRDPDEQPMPGLDPVVAPFPPE